MGLVCLCLPRPKYLIHVLWLRRSHVFIAQIIHAHSFDSVRGRVITIEVYRIITTFAAP